MINLAAVKLGFGFNNGARPYQAHFQPQDIYQLRQFVQAGLPQEATDPRYSWIVSQLLRGIPLFGATRVGRQDLLQDFVSIHDHGAKFEAMEVLAMRAETAMSEESRAAVPFYGNRDRQEEWADNDDKGCSGYNINCDFQEPEQRL